MKSIVLIFRGKFSWLDAVFPKVKAAVTKTPNEKVPGPKAHSYFLIDMDVFQQVDEQQEQKRGKSAFERIWEVGRPHSLDPDFVRDIQERLSSVVYIGETSRQSKNGPEERLEEHRQKRFVGRNIAMLVVETFEGEDSRNASRALRSEHMLGTFAPYFPSLEKDWRPGRLNTSKYTKMMDEAFAQMLAYSPEELEQLAWLLVYRFCVDMENPETGRLIIGRERNHKCTHCGRQFVFEFHQRKCEERHRRERVLEWMAESEAFRQLQLMGAGVVFPQLKESTTAATSFDAFPGAFPAATPFGTVWPPSSLEEDLLSKLGKAPFLPPHPFAFAPLSPLSVVADDYSIGGSEIRGVDLDGGSVYYPFRATFASLPAAPVIVQPNLTEPVQAPSNGLKFGVEEIGAAVGKDGVSEGRTAEGATEEGLFWRGRRRLWDEVRLWRALALALLCCLALTAVGILIVRGAKRNQKRGEKDGE